MAVELIRRKIKVSDYHRMFETGILTIQDKVELINGEIIEMSPSGSLHAAIVDRISNFLMQSLGNQVIVRTQSPVQISELSLPEPDISVLKPVKDFYAELHPQAQDIYLIIEVADTSYRYDKEIKLPVYAKAGIPEYWIINIERKEIEAHRAPHNEVFSKVDIIQLDQKLTFQAFDLEIKAPSLLG